MPKIYLRKIIYPKTKLMAYEVVDGQQRLRAIIDFYKGGFPLNKRHNPQLGGVTFDGLPDSIQRIFLQYEISTEVMENAPDREVWAMFERLNTYTLPLNRQEKLNAKWFGYFKQTAYSLAADQAALDAWEQMKVFSNRQIARMKEVELTSDVLVAIVEGISDLTKIKSAYEKYDSNFPRRDNSAAIFRKSLSFIASELAETVRNTKFRSRTWFYSLMVAVADARCGIFNGRGAMDLRPKDEIQKRMLVIHSALSSLELPPALADLQTSLTRRPSHANERRVRHNYFYEMLTLSESSWSERWSQLTSPN
jgi:hypothetical protein